MREKRTFKKTEKLAILKEASEQGVKVTLEKHGIYAATYYSWRKKFKEMGETGLDHGMNQQHLKRIRELEKENRQLKELVAEKELAVRMHEEIKKRWALEKKSKR
jgi:putative transposase